MRRAFKPHDMSLEPKSANGYKAAIHILAGSLGLDRDTRQDLQRNLTGVESCADMTIQQLRTVHHRLAQLANALPHAKPYVLKPHKRPGRDERLPDEPISVEQMELIKHLAEHVNFHGPSLRNFSAWCQKTCGRPWPQTRAEANKIIEALKAMERRGWKTRETASG